MKKSEKSERTPEFGLLDEKSNKANGGMNYSKAREAAELLKNSGLTIEIDEEERRKLLKYILEEEV